MININVPLLSKGKPKGIRVVPQSTEGFDEYYERRQNEQGQTVFQLAAGSHRHEENPTDSIALADGFITITALAIGMTDHTKTRRLQKLFYTP
jgi:broad specificity polyphosphatase/5'/3'-nucleotidase SurE